MSLIWLDDPATEVARIAERGLRPVSVKQYGNVRKWVFHDADGNVEHSRGSERVDSPVRGLAGPFTTRCQW